MDDVAQVVTRWLEGMVTAEEAMGLIMDITTDAALSVIVLADKEEEVSNGS